MSYDAAFDLVKRKRACVKPNSGFVKYVLAYCRILLLSPFVDPDACKNGNDNGGRLQGTVRSCVAPRRLPAKGAQPAGRAVRSTHAHTQTQATVNHVRLVRPRLPLD